MTTSAEMISRYEGLRYQLASLRTDLLLVEHHQALLSDRASFETRQEVREFLEKARQFIGGQEAALDGFHRVVLKDVAPDDVAISQFTNIVGSFEDTEYNLKRYTDLAAGFVQRLNALID